MFARIIHNYFRFTTVLYMVLALFLLESCAIFKSKQSKNKPNEAQLRQENGVRDLLAKASTYLGTPYVYGGQSTLGMDCSGLTYICAQHVGKTLPRHSAAQASIGVTISKDALQKGDLVFFSTNPNSSAINHVGIVSVVELPHNLKFIHASSSKGVVEDNLLSNYWKKTFVKAQRAFVF
jgi:probable lipoprotein NlpC